MSSFNRTILDTAMSIPGHTVRNALILMQVFITLSQNDTKATGRMIEFGTYVGRVSYLLGKLARKDENLVLVDSVPYLDEELLKREQISFDFFQMRSEDYLASTISNVMMNITHHDASHYFDNVHSELKGVKNKMDENGLIILDDFTDPFSQVRAAYYYSRYRENFPWELLLIGFGKAILVNESRFNYWEEFVLDRLYDDLMCYGVRTMLHRTDVTKWSRAFYLRVAKDDEPVRYGLNTWGDRFYRKGLI